MMRVTAPLQWYERHKVQRNHCWPEWKWRGSFIINAILYWIARTVMMIGIRFNLFESVGPERRWFRTDRQLPPDALHVWIRVQGVERGLAMLHKDTGDDLWFGYSGTYTKGQVTHWAYNLEDNNGT